jgi:hypothetical protein
MLNKLYDVNTHAFRQSFWMINTSNCCIIESIKNDIMIFFWLFSMLYYNMINIRCVFIIFRFACLSSSYYLRFAVLNVHAIFFQKIYIEKSSMRCWHFDCWSFTKCWRCVDVLLMKTLLFLIFVMMIICLIIFVSYNCRFSNTWSLYLEMTKILFSKKMIRSQRLNQFVRNFFSFFHQRNNVFSTQMRRYFFVLFLNAKSIWKITCHLICFFFRFLFCMKTIKQYDFHRN